MSTVVIDTNVLKVANRGHNDVSGPCVAECVKRLLAVRSAGTVVVDDGWRIFREYTDNLKATQQPGVGDEFVKWLLQNRANAQRVHQVCLDETAENEFSQFPDAALQAAFDPKDRKFVAAAAAHADRPPIIQAADGKWVGWWAALHQHGIQVQFPCPVDIKGFYRSAFPGVAVPALPDEAP